MAGCKTAARNNEPGVPVGNGHGEAARHRHALERIQCAGYGGPEVKSRISRMGVLGRRQLLIENSDAHIHSAPPYPSSPRAEENSSTLWKSLYTLAKRM